MKTAIIVFATILTSLNAFAEGPILNCKATREGPRSDGKPGYERVDEKDIVTVITSRIKTTDMVGVTVKTFVDEKGNYLLVLSDKELGTSSTNMGTLENKNINLSLDGNGYSNFITCTVQ